MAHADQNATGMEAYFRPSKPYKLTCACQVDSPGPDWIDAGCVFHGVMSGAGQFDGEKVFDDFRRALMPGNRPQPSRNVSGFTNPRPNSDTLKEV